jgi:hypothetical protein
MAATDALVLDPKCPRQQLVLGHDVIDRAKIQRFGRGERLALEDRHQRPVGADQPGQPLRAAAAGHDAEKNLGLADEEVPVGHHPQVVGPGEFGTQPERRPVERGHEDDAAGVHAQERLVHTLEVHRRAERCAVQHRTQHGTDPVRPLGGAGQRRRPPPADRGKRGPALLQPAKLGVAYEAVRMGAGEHDGVDVGVGVGAVHQRFELVGDLRAEHLVRSPVDPDDQHGAPIPDLEVALSFVAHGTLPSWNEVMVRDTRTITRL